MTLVTNRLRPMTFMLAIAGLCFMGLMEGCSSNKQEKVEDKRGDLREEKEDVAAEQRDVAEEQREVQEAEMELNEAQRAARTEWQQDYLSFKRDMIGEISANEQLLLEKREQAAALDATLRDQYNTAIGAAEQRNNELRQQLNNATDQGDEVWTKFKEDFRNTVNQVEESIRNIDVK
jgi:hypothetical protein